MVSKSVADICVLWGVRRVFTTPYHPQANWVERVNRNMMSMLCSFVKGSHTEWDEHIAKLMFTLNSFTHDSTRFSPAELFLNRKIRGPGEWIHQREQLNVIDKVESERMFTVARENMLHRTMQNKVEYDEKRNKVSISVDDMVLLRSHALSNMQKKFSAKLAPKWRGPYRVVARTSPVTFVIEDSSVNEKRIAHVDQLKLVK